MFGNVFDVDAVFDVGLKKKKLIKHSDGIWTSNTIHFKFSEEKGEKSLFEKVLAEDGIDQMLGAWLLKLGING
jgi:hypothetical protein